MIRENIYSTLNLLFYMYKVKAYYPHILTQIMEIQTRITDNRHYIGVAQLGRIRDNFVLSDKLTIFAKVIYFPNHTNSNTGSEPIRSENERYLKPVL